MTLLRAEFRRLFRWLKDIGVSAIIITELGDQTMTRPNMEQYVSDYMIILDQRIKETILKHRREMEARKREFERKRHIMEPQIEILRAQLAGESDELEYLTRNFNELAGSNQIIAVPTLISKLPGSVRRLIGDFSKTDLALAGLGLKP
ncbi:MAG: hypothetical protein HQK57_13040 [Deltaproteobacteria bacterium]|nr:hypothetical protein [Deltaproteobacteria bacterium]